MLLVAAASAQETKGTGTIEGSVLNSTNGLYLNKARVYVENTSLEVYTNETGEYELRNVPAGTVTVKVSYTGQTTLSDTILVEADKVARKFFMFNAATVASDKDGAGTLVLDAYVVESKRYRNAQEIAAQEERAATNIKSVVATDSLGYIPDGNIGDFVKFLPGVEIGYGGPGDYNSPADASSVSVRGFGADSTAVYIDGVPMASASPSTLTRAVQIDQVSINNASRVEIIKVATPDMRQDSPGGAVNLITPGAFEQAKPSYNLSVALNADASLLSLQKEPGPVKGSTYRSLPSVRVGTTIPLTKNLGFSFSVASDNKSSNMQYSKAKSWTFKSSSSSVQNAKGILRIDNPALSGDQVYNNQWLEYKQSGNLRFDWRPFKGLTLKANFQPSRMDSSMADRRMDFRVGTLTDWGSSYSTGKSGTVQQTIITRDREGFTNSGYLQAEFNRGPWQINAKISGSESYNALDDIGKGHFSGIDSNTLKSSYINIENIVDGTPSKITMWDSVGNPIDYSSMAGWGKMSSFDVQSGTTYSRDLNKQYSLDVARQLDFVPFPLTVKIGALRNEKGTHKWGRGTNYYYRYVGPSLQATDYSTDFSTSGKQGLGLKDRQYWLDTYKLYNLYQQNPTYFDDNYIDTTTAGTGGVNNLARNYNSYIGQQKGLTETTTEWYGMLTASYFHNRLDVITGIRRGAKSLKGYNIFRDSMYNYVKLANGSIYRDSVYTSGVKIDGTTYTGATANSAGLYDNVITDTALRARMLAAGVVNIPTKLELAPNGTAAGTTSNNLNLAKLWNYTRAINAKRTNPSTPQLQLAYKLTESLRVQASYSREIRMPDLESSDSTSNTALLNGGASFIITPYETETSDLGGQGKINISNVNNDPEITHSYNARVSYYTKYAKYSASYYVKITPKQWVDAVYYNDDAEYYTLLAAAGMDASTYNNYSITTTSTTGATGRRTGVELEAVQNMGFLGSVASGFDLYLTYTRRTLAANSISSMSTLGWVSEYPARARWTGGVSYSQKRFSIQAKGIYTESGITGMTTTSVTMPNGTTQNVMFYTLNKAPMNLNLQFNYILASHLKYFLVADRVLETRTSTQKTDAVTDLAPSYSRFTVVNERGIALSTGITANF